MSDREAMQLALDALEMMEPYADQLTDFSSTATEWSLNLLPGKTVTAITALRAALAAPEPDHDAEVEALRRDAERYKWLLNWLAKTGLLYSEYCRIDTPASVGDWWILHKPKVIDGSSVIGHGETANATIDAAMKEPPR